MTSDIKSLYRFLRERNIIKKSHPEYEPEVIRPISPKRENGQEPNNPAQSQEVVSKNRAEFIKWKSELSEKDLSDFNFIFGE